MAKMSLKVTGFDELIQEFNAIGEKAKPAAEAAVKAGAGVLADNVRANLKEILSGESTGDLENSLGISPVGDQNGIINARIGFDGYDRNGTPNALKANVLESGSSRQPKKHRFVRTAVNSSKDKVKRVMADKFDEEIQKETKG